MRNDFFGEMAETGGVPLNASPVRRWAGVFGHRPFAFSISMGVKTSDGMNWNLQDLVYEALSEEWRKRDGEISDPWANDEAGDVLLEQHRRVVADARVRERGELVRIVSP